MKRKELVKRRIAAFSLSAMLALGCLPMTAFAQTNAGNPTQEAGQPAAQAGNIMEISPENDLTRGEHAVLVDNDRGGKALHIKTNWVSSGDGTGGIKVAASFKDATIFKKTEFTLYMDVYRLENGNPKNASKVAFYAGNTSKYFSLRMADDQGSLSISGTGKNFTKSNPSQDRKFSSVAVSYKEDSASGKVTIYIDGIKVLDQADVGFKLSTMGDIKAALGAGQGTGYMVEGVYDNIRVSDTAVTGDTVEVPSRYQPYNSFSGTKQGYGGTLGSSVKVAEWLDTNGNHIQAHGGQVQWLDNLDLDGDGAADGGYIWYGEDKTRNGKPIDGIHCYTSPDLYNWTDRGIVLYTHDVVPDKLNGSGDGIEPNAEGLADLKAWAELSAPSDSVTQEQIDMAKAFVAAYRTSSGYDEENLGKAFKYLYTGYGIAERPKMLYNETTKKYVLVWHADGPSDENISKYLKDNNQSPSRYSRASMGFAVSDTPYGPFKLVNVQRMNYKTGGDYDTNQGMARDMTVFLDDTDINKDGVKDAYAVYSSESNKYMYISLLNSDYTGPITEGATDSLTLSDGTTVQTFAGRVLGSAINREAPAVFKYNGKYYMITSGTDGWKACDAKYFMADNIYGPWTAMGDPCEGGSSNTFVSQPTAVIPVDAERGQFIYMGDRWSYTLSGSNTDSAHWDSSYVWLPIDVKLDGSIVMKNRSDWDLSELEKPIVNTELPKIISSMDELPATINVTTNAGTKDTGVTWSGFNNENFTVQTVTGTLTDLGGQTVDIAVAVAPDNMAYFVDCGTDGTSNSFYYDLVKEALVENSTVSDQAYSSEKKWGYVGDNTTQRDSGSRNVHERFRYVVEGKPERNIVYQFDGLEEGNYSIYLGFFDPWYQYSQGKRVATVTLQQGSNVLGTSEQLCGGDGTIETAAYENLTLEGTDSLQITLAPKNTGDNSDIQVSWIAIVDNSKRPTVSGFELDQTAVGKAGETVDVSGTLTLSKYAQASEALLTEEIGKITWESTDEAVAKVKECSGTASKDFRSSELAVTVEAVAEGKATIKGTTAEGLEASCEVTVVGADVEIYTITYELDGGTAAGNPGTYTAETESFTLKNPTKEGYTFTGWTGFNGTEPQTEVTVEKGTTGNLTFTANWEKNAEVPPVEPEEPETYTITYELDGGTVEGNPATYTAETETFTLKNPTKEGYTFTGWTGTNGTEPQTEVTVIKGTTGNLTFTANWEKNAEVPPVEPEEPEIYTITYELDGGTVEGNPESYTEETETFMLVNPSKEGYTFIGWTGSNGDEPQLEVTVEKGTKGNLSYVANWEEITLVPGIYPITYELDGGILTGHRDAYTKETETFTLRKPKKEGYVFIGWTGSNGDEPQLEVTIEQGSKGSLIFYANWEEAKEEPKTYTITYNLNGGIVQGNPETYTAETETFTLKNPTKEGYTFTGWTGSNGTKPQTEVVVAKGTEGNLAYTANWKQNETPGVNGNPGDNNNPGDNTDTKEPVDISKDAKVTLGKTSYTYDGKKKKPSVTVRAGSVKLKANQDYTITYKNNTKVGTATAVVTGKGDYTGTVKKEFTINPKGMSISGKLKALPKGFTVKWKKQPKSITGYRVQYSTSKKFTKKTTITKLVKKNSATGLTVKKLKGKKKYYVRVGTFQVVKGVKYYSNWSKANSVTTKK